MELSAPTIKIVLSVITALIGAFGILYNFKKKSEVDGEEKEVLTLPGYVSILGLLLALVLSAHLEVTSYRKESVENKKALAQLEKENEQRETLLKDLKIVQRSLNLSLDGLSKNILATRSLESNLTVLSKMQLEQQSELGLSIGEFEEKVNNGIKKLSSPISDLYFSFKLSFSDAQELVPSYFNLFEPEYINEDGGYATVEREIPREFDSRNSFFFQPKYTEVKFYKGLPVESVYRGMFKDRSPDLFYKLDDLSNTISTLWMYSDPYKDYIHRNFRQENSKLISMSGEIISNFDFSKFSEPGDYVVVTLSSSYPGDVLLSDFKIHTHKSKKSGVVLPDCHLLDKFTYGTIAFSETDVINNSMYTYVCKLWLADDAR